MKHQLMGGVGSGLRSSTAVQVFISPRGQHTLHKTENQEVCDVLQHSDSEGMLPGKRRSLQLESETDRPAEEEEELSNRKNSLERLICSEEEEEEEAGRLSPQHSHQTEDSEPDEILLEDEQVDDFASSVLAAISCWHYRVQAFLSTTGTVSLSAASPVFSLALRKSHTSSVTH